MLFLFPRATSQVTAGQNRPIIKKRRICMKQKKQTEVPDSVFEAFGFTLPKSIPKEYQAGSSITDFVGGGRILSLKKEWHFKKMATPKCPKHAKGFPSYKTFWNPTRKNCRSAMPTVIQDMLRKLHALLSACRPVTASGLTAWAVNTSMAASV